MAIITSGFSVLQECTRGVRGKGDFLLVVRPFLISRLSSSGYRLAKLLRPEAKLWRVEYGLGSFPRNLSDQAKKLRPVCRRLGFQPKLY
jgi:hypothetical protein